MENLTQTNRFRDVIRTYWKMITAITLSAGLCALFSTYVISDKYEASSAVLVRAQDLYMETQKGKEAIGFPITFSSTEPIVETYSALMKSPLIAERIVEALGIKNVKFTEDIAGNIFIRTLKKVRRTVKHQIAALWTWLKYGYVKSQDPYESAVSRIHTSMEVKPEKDTFLINFSVKLPNAQVAAVVANTAADVFIEYSRQIMSEEVEKKRAAITERIEETRSKIERAREEMMTFKEEHKIASIEKQVYFKVMGMEDHLSDLNETKLQLEGLLKIQSLLLQPEVDMQSLSSYVKVLDNPMILEMRKMILEEELEIAGLLKKYTHDHPTVRVAEAILKDAKEALLKEVNSDIEYYSQKKESIERNLNTYRKDLEALSTLEKNVEDMNMNIRAMEEDYVFLSKAYEDIHLLEAQKPDEIKFLHRASVPLYPVGPIKILYVGVALVVGLIVSTGLAFFMSYMDSSIKSARDAEAILGMPVLSSIPAVPKLKENQWILLTPHG